MREILFRGKGTIDSGYSANKWVYGYYCEDFWNHRKGHGILPVDKECGSYVEVAPETVGQFTGLTDKNGKRIFEGDIMRNAGNVVEFCNGGSCINGDSPLALWTKTEVIGNRWDNPELLKGGEGHD